MRGFANLRRSASIKIYKICNTDCKGFSVRWWGLDPGSFKEYHIRMDNGMIFHNSNHFEMCILDVFCNSNRFGMWIFHNSNRFEMWIFHNPNCFEKTVAEHSTWYIIDDDGYTVLHTIQTASKCSSFYDVNYHPNSAYIIPQPAIQPTSKCRFLDVGCEELLYNIQFDYMCNKRT